MRLRVGLAVVVVALLAASASAGTVKISIVLNPAAPGCTGCTLSGPGTYDVYAQDVTASPFAPDHTPMYGIVSYGLPILNVNDFLHRAPRASLVDDSAGSGDSGPAGFSNLRSGNNATPIGTCPGATCGGFFIGATQDTTTPTPFLIGGYGQTAGSFAADVPPTATVAGTIQPSWGAKLLLGEGHWTPNNPNRVPTLGLASVDAFVNGFADPALGQVSKQAVIPEPASIVLAGLAVIGLLGLRRRK
jgi:PEP-CTERM motif